MIAPTPLSTGPSKKPNLVNQRLYAVGSQTSKCEKQTFNGEAPNACLEPIVLKNSKIRHAHFLANFHCSSKVDATCSEQAVTAAYIATQGIWPTT